MYTTSSVLHGGRMSMRALAPARVWMCVMCSYTHCSCQNDNIVCRILPCSAYRALMAAVGISFLCSSVRLLAAWKMCTMQMVWCAHNLKPPLNDNHMLHNAHTHTRQWNEKTMLPATIPSTEFRLPGNPRRIFLCDSIFRHITYDSRLRLVVHTHRIRKSISHTIFMRSAL